MTLDTLCTRAPWSGVSTRGWGNDDGWTLTEQDVRAAYAAIVAGASKDALCAALGVDGLSRDKAARCLGLLKGVELIYYTKGVGWRAQGGASTPLSLLCARAPYSGTNRFGPRYGAPAWTLNATEIREVYAAVVGGKGAAGICESLSIKRLSEDKANRCLFLLKNAGLIHFVKGTGWVPRGTV